VLETLLGNKSAYWVMLYLYHYGEIYPTMVADALELSMNPIKAQLKKLSDAGILARKKTGNMNIYFFNEKAAMVKPLKEIIRIEYDNISSADKNKLFKHRARARREGKPVVT
jgi:predicted transcriptional regulator